MANKQNDQVEKTIETKQKTCFVIMPIADHPEYSTDHFTRVYNHLIKPACEKAGFKAIRADDAKSSNMIMFDILKKIVECDMAICDLSSKNANVFYELGLRQAFNKKTILITDDITNTPFDITGFRYVKYSESLRVDTVLRDTNEIAAMLEETENASEDEINSIVNLLKIQPAQVNKIQLNEQESVLYELVKNLDAKVSSLSNSAKNSHGSGGPKLATVFSKSLLSGKSFEEMLTRFPLQVHSTRFREGDIVLGVFSGHDSHGNLLFTNKDRDYLIEDNEFNRATIYAV